MVEFYRTAIGHLEEAERLQRRLSVTRDPLSVLEAVRETMDLMFSEGGFQEKLGAALRPEDTEAIRSKTLHTLEECLSGVRERYGPEAEQERSEAMEVLRACLAELRAMDPVEHQALSFLLLRVERVMDLDSEELARVDGMKNAKERRDCICAIVEEHMANGTVGVALD
ncbi:MAG: hypothetical protein Greene041619_744 [Candidatus Peregrinibacteria bacterium Greene0416_19]|nr:MAG: hypothetical protein Greene041619_744 [Candidatus Peregrinibacteria bacterium Greene0416_19]